jgi:hypothetical protein
MSTMGFDIPHDKGTPLRDIITVQCPFPAKKIGSVWTPAISRELSQHTHQMGIIRQMGPMAFKFNDGDGMKTHDAKVGDWVLFKWGAGTTFLAGRGVSMPVGGYRYLSSYADVIKVIPAADGPDPATLSWVDDGDDIGDALDHNKQSDFNFNASRAAAGNGLIGASE